MAVSPIPEGYHTATPYLIVKGAEQALEFYQRAFGAVELYRLAGPDGRICHAEFQIGDSRFMISNENPEIGCLSPESLGGSGASFVLYVEDADSRFRQAIEAGGKEQAPLQDQFYGARSGTLTDPFGHVWTVATQTEVVSPEEMNRRIEAMMKSGTCAESTVKA